MLFGFGAPLGDVGVTQLIALDYHRLKSCLHTRCGIRAVRRCRYKQHFTFRCMFAQIAADGYQTRIFACCAGSRLQGACLKAGELTEHFFQLFLDGYVAFHLLLRRKRMHSQESRERDRHHCRCGIELHCTRTQRNHRVRQRDILACQAVHITHHLRFRVVFSEHLGLQVIRLAHTALVNRPQSLKRALILNRHTHSAHYSGEEFGEVIHIIGCYGFIQRQAYPSFIVVIEINLRIFGCLLQRLYAHVLRQVDLQCIKELVVLLRVAVGLQHLAQIDRLAMYLLGNLAQSFSAVILCVERYHHRTQSLSRTDVRCGFLALDMLLARLQSKAVSRAFVHVFA